MDAVGRIRLTPAIVASAAAGDTDAFASIVAEHHDDMVRVAYLVSGDVDPDPIGQAWSPDSRWLAFSARGGAATAGTWVVRADGTGLRRISTRVLDPIAWGPAPP